MGESPSPIVATLPSLMKIGSLGDEIICHVTWGHKIKNHITFGLEPLTPVDHCAKFDAYRSYGSGDFVFVFSNIWQYDQRDINMEPSFISH